MTRLKYFPIPDFPDYTISRKGKVKKFGAMVPLGRGSDLEGPEAFIILQNNNKKQAFKIHQLIKQVFPEEIDNG